MRKRESRVTLGCEVGDQGMYRIRTLHKAFKISMRWRETDLIQIRKTSPQFFTEVSSKLCARRQLQLNNPKTYVMDLAQQTKTTVTTTKQLWSKVVV